MTRRLTASLRGAPTTLPALLALALFVLWATDQAGYPLTHWAPGGLIVLGLLGISLAIVPLRVREIPPAVRVAILCLAAYTALSFLSILWAGVPGDAWEGANRTLLYLLVFLLFAAWPQRGPSGALLLCAWTLALIGLAAFTTLHVADGSVAKLLPDGRLVYPTGYPNANAALWLMAFWPAILLARSERLHWALRGVLAGGAVLLAAIALLSQSRGSLYATPVMLVLVFALLPGRLRTFAVLVPVGAAFAATAPAVLRVGDRIDAGGDVRGALQAASLAIFAAALVVGLLVAAWGAVESRRELSPPAAARVRRGVGAVALLALLAVLLGGIMAAGDPLTRVEDGWQSFKGGYQNGSGGSRLVGGLGSNRYDFYRVALDELAAHPVVGIGAENYAQQYLRHGRSLETPHYPHSVELRALTQTGVLGALLAAVGLAAALLAGWGAVRRRGWGDIHRRRSPRARAWARAEPRRGHTPEHPLATPEEEEGPQTGPLPAKDSLAGVVAAAALGGFAYWAVHGSVDWFWEFAGLGAPAFALLGLACALAPRAPRATAKAPAEGARRGLLLGFGALAALAATLSLAAPWLSQMQVQAAARIWPAAPAKAFARLGDSARLNPLSDEPYVVAGSIALRFGDLRRAERQFELALGRVPDDAYATLELGAIASTRGERRRARRLLRRAAELNPRDPLTRRAEDLAGHDLRVDVQELNRSILIEAQQLS